jgi:hypothetical protein
MTQFNAVDHLLSAFNSHERIGLKILEMVEKAIEATGDEAAAGQPDVEREDAMDGDAESALAPAGLGTDYDYGCFAQEEGDR